MLESLRLLLKGEGYAIDAASSPAGILSKLEREEFDVLLMDLNYTRDTTSGQEGLDLLSRIQAADSTLPVVVMTAWGGPQRRIYGVLGFEMFSAVSFVLMGWQPSAWLIALGAFTAHFAIAIILASNQALWQSKVTPEVQGRVFATQQMVAQATRPLAFLIAGPLADYVFNPWLMPGGMLTGSAGPFIGIGPGRGIALLFVVMGVIKFGVVLAGFLNPHIRQVEDELPDVIVEEKLAAVAG